MSALLQPIIPQAVATAPARRILLLDDDEGIKSVLGTFLQEHGFAVHSVSNGVEGIRALAGEPFDFVVCDMMMPSLPGDMFYLAVERMRPELCPRFIFITGHDSNPKIKNFIQSINGTLLLKPFKLADLIDMLGFAEVRALLAA